MRLTQLKLARIQAGKLQVELATATGIARGRMSEIECGYIQPRPDELERIANVLGVPVERLQLQPEAAA